MQFTVASVIAIFASLVMAQDLHQIPDCAIKCIASTFKDSGCSSPFDFDCVCHAPIKWDQEVGCCVIKGCTQADGEKTVRWKQNLCKNMGITWIPPTLQGVCL